MLSSGWASWWGVLLALSWLTVEDKYIKGSSSGDWGLGVGVAIKKGAWNGMVWICFRWAVGRWLASEYGRSTPQASEHLVCSAISSRCRAAGSEEYRCTCRCCTRAHICSVDYCDDPRFSMRGSSEMTTLCTHSPDRARSTCSPLELRTWNSLSLEGQFEKRKKVPQCCFDRKPSNLSGKVLWRLWLGEKEANK